MTPEQLDKSAHLFEEALELPENEVSEFINRESGEDPEVCAEVERLFKVKQNMAAPFLEEPASGWLNPSQLKRGQKIRRYEIEEQLGKGGMSVVYRALDTGIGRHVALKLLFSAGDEAGPTGMFFSELRTLGALRLENIVQVYDFGEFNGLPYIVMECLEGEDLSKAIEGNRCGDFAARLSIARQVATVLRDVHAAKIVHRDVKPANVFLTASGRIKLMDFGMARDDRPRGSQVSIVMGTPEYISPEQIKGERATFRSDIYSFGILLFELFSGTRPYGGTTAALLYKAIAEPLPLGQLEKSLPKPLIDLIRDATEKDPQKRTASLEHILAALDHVEASLLESSRGRLSRVTPARTIGGVAVTVFAGVVLFLRSNSHNQPPPPQDIFVSPKITQSPGAEVKDPKPKPPVEDKSAPANPMLKTSNAPDKRASPPPKLEPPDASEVGAPPRKPLSQPDPSLPDGPSIQPSAGIGPPPNSGSILLPGAPAETGPTKATSHPEPPPDPHAVHRRELLAVLENYTAAWRRRDIKQVATLFPNAPLRSIKAIFDGALKVGLELTMEEPPRFSGSGPFTAQLRCRQTTTIEYANTRIPTQTVARATVTAGEYNGSWRIISIELHP